MNDAPQKDVTKDVPQAVQDRLLKAMTEVALAFEDYRKARPHVQRITDYTINFPGPPIRAYTVTLQQVPFKAKE